MPRIQFQLRDRQHLVEIDNFDIIVNDVIGRLAEDFQVSNDSIRIVMHGHFLEGDRTLNSYNINEDTILNFVSGRPAGGRRKSRRRKSRRRKSRRRKSRRRKSRRRKSRRRKSRRRKSRRRKSRRRKSRRRKFYGGGKYRYEGKIDAFCGENSILKEEYRSCNDRLLVSVEILDDKKAIKTAFGHIPVVFGKEKDADDKIDGIDINEWILNKIKTTAKGSMDEITLDNLIILKGFFAIEIDQATKKDEGTVVITNSDILLDEYKANSAEKIKNKYPKKFHKRGDVCTKPPHCFSFVKGLGAKAFKAALEEKDLRGKQFILLEASGPEGLVQYYKRLGFGEPVILNYPWGGASIIMYSTIQHVRDILNAREGEKKAAAGVESAAAAGNGGESKA